MKPPLAPSLGDDFARQPQYPPDFLFPQDAWSGLGDLDELRFLERRLSQEQLIPLSYVRLRERLGFALLTMDMQNRWKRAWQETLTRNRQALDEVTHAANAAPTQRFLLLGPLDACCTLYPDPGVRPADTLSVLVDSTEARQRMHATLPSGHVLEGVTAPDAGGLRIDAARLFAEARPAAQTPAPSYAGLYVTQDAPRLTRDATRSAHEAAQPDTPARPRPRTGSAAPAGDADVAPRIPDAPNVLLMRREHALLLAVIAWAGAPAARRCGLHAWEITEMTRRWAFDWSWMAAEARQWRVTGVVGAVLDELHDVWRGAIPAAERARLQPGPVGRWIVRAAGPQMAQRVLSRPLLRLL